jgi:gliding motility-associated-like protein
MALFLVVGQANAQLQVTSGITATDAVQNILLGPGVTASNITFSGNASQLGSFIGTNCYLGLDSGVIMASGGVFGALGPNNSGSTSNPPNLPDGVTDIDLQALNGAGGAGLNNTAVLQFDFVPTGDSLAFNFIFASEEYLEYVGSSFNDIFGFFLSGPGISGPYTNNGENIALVPGTSTAIAINNLNNVSNSQYYVNNGTGFNSPYNTNNQYIQYNGLTTVLTASATVQCGATYHIKLAIGDRSDGSYDSAVFLQAGSFQSNAVTLSTQINGGGQDSTLYEGCGSATFFISRQGNMTETDTVPLIAGGTATEGLDYDPIPSQLIFQPGVDTIMVMINAIDDGTPEPPELIELLAYWIGDCGADSTMLHLYISDPPPIGLSMTHDTLLTCGDSTLLQAHVSGGYGDLTLDWNAGIPDGDTLAWLHPPQTTTYILTVSDECGVLDPVDSMTVNVFIPDTFMMQTQPDTSVNCPESPVALYAHVSGGTPPYTYVWSEGLGYTDSLNVAPVTSHGYDIAVIDRCGNMLNGLTMVTVTYDSMRVKVLPDTLICYGDTITLKALVHGGYSTLLYDWNAGGTADTLAVHPATSSTYWVTVTDQCAISGSSYAPVYIERPIADFSILGSGWESNFPIGFMDESAGAITDWNWDFGSDGLTSTEVNPVVTYSGPGAFPVRLAIRDTLGCVDTLIKTLNVAPEFNLYLPTAFSPDGDGINEVFGAVGTSIRSFHMQVFDRWGKLVFETEDPTKGWDGTVNGRRPVPGVYTYLYRFLGPSGQTADRYGSVMLVR